MDKQTYDALYNKVVHASLSELVQIVESEDHQVLVDISEKLENDAVFMIRKGEYLEARCYAGMTHKNAVKKQNKRAAAIRKVLTYMVTHEVNF